MKKQIIVLLLTSVLLLSSVPSAMAQFEMPNLEDLMRTILRFIFGDYPAGWLNTNSFMQIVIFPFIAIFAVFYGLLTELKIFKGQRTTKLVIALMFSFGGSWFALSSMKGFMIINATLATWGFGIVLFLGIIFWAGARISESWYDVSGKQIFGGMKTREADEKNLAGLRERRVVLFANWNSAVMSPKKSIRDQASTIRGELTKVEGDIENLEKKIRGEVSGKAGG